MTVAQTPPMGWNSWDCYGASVTEAEVRGNAEYMAQNLRDLGWEYVIVDIQWYEPGAYSSQYRPFVPLEMDEFSRLIPAANRFPSAAGGLGFRPLAEYVHSLGLKFGIHIMRGIPRQAVHHNTPISGTSATARDIAHPNSICPWNTDMYGVDASKEGAQAYYNSLFELYASWGVDFVKVDDIAASRLYGYHAPEVELIRNAIDHCGREMVLSLSPGPAALHAAEHLKHHASMWRMTDDLWDHWEHVQVMFDRCHEWSQHAGPGHWPDADMLPLGHIGIRSVDGGGADRMCRLSEDEQRTLMTLWCIAKSPLMFGGELRDLDPFTLSLLTNREVLHMHRTSTGNRQLFRRGDQVVWTARGEAGETYLALFNTGMEPDIIQVNGTLMGLNASLTVSNLWTGAQVTEHSNQISAEVPAHGAVLVKVLPA
ncbi:glycoside hydrolase family 27 protein [Deinococcus cellulosilyticus]|uniref:Alpha-galactosidase n=1 Tax=Deinococcus cellulosilyticus (strain DSM 18568 / NBRC 106333 / KACC 11606 / 5516J-15) TaxID=1223518 RepID=A0A511N1L9_DEIC1|nr:glycoside hydrolase family 27 protein [Deinococcus cellulosilyticus]GEM46774.1 alpha-galactosidase [Deinococcus cellulosilyticus NBRC 106333 = KACC 11606]